MIQHMRQKYDTTYALPVESILCLFAYSEIIMSEAKRSLNGVGERMLWEGQRVRNIPSMY